MPSPEPNPTPTKTIVKGVFTRDGIPAAANPVRVATVKVRWADLEPAPGARTLEPILDALAAAEARGLDGVRLRPMFGADAPAWAKQLGAGPIPYAEPQGRTQTSIPDIWAPAYQAAVESELDFLCDGVDHDPRLRLIFATGAMTYYGEPFIRGTSDARNRAAFLAAGYTKAKDAAAQKWQLDAMGRWRTTPIGLSYNAWQFVDADGSAGSSISYMAEVMDHQLALFGERTVLQNNSIRASYISSPPPIYAEFVERLSAPGQTQFQVAGATRVGDAGAVMDWAIDHLEATGVELVNGYGSFHTDAELRDYDARLKANR